MQTARLAVFFQKSGNQQLLQTILQIRHIRRHHLQLGKIKRLTKNTGGGEKRALFFGKPFHSFLHGLLNRRRKLFHRKSGFARKFIDAAFILYNSSGIDQGSY